MGMSVWTREELTTHIAACKQALLAAATGEKYDIDGRSLTRQRLESLRSQLAFYEEELAKLDGRGSIRVIPMRPRR